MVAHVAASERTAMLPLSVHPPPLRLLAHRSSWQFRTRAHAAACATRARCVLLVPRVHVLRAVHPPALWVLTLCPWPCRVWIVQSRMKKYATENQVWKKLVNSEMGRLEKQHTRLVSETSKLKLEEERRKATIGELVEKEKHLRREENKLRTAKKKLMDSTELKSKIDSIDNLKKYFKYMQLDGQLRETRDALTLIDKQLGEARPTHKNALKEFGESRDELVAPPPTHRLPAAPRGPSTLAVQPPPRTDCPLRRLSTRCRAIRFDTRRAGVAERRRLAWPLSAQDSVKRVLDDFKLFTDSRGGQSDLLQTTLTKMAEADDTVTPTSLETIFTKCGLVSTRGGPAADVRLALSSLLPQTAPARDSSSQTEEGHIS